MDKLGKQEKQFVIKNTPSTKVPMQSGTGPQKLNVKIMQKSDIKGQSTIRINNSKVSRQNYQTFNSKQGQKIKQQSNSAAPNMN